MIEGLGIDEWIFATLAADASVQSALGTVAPRIYPDDAPQGTLPPYILFNQQSSVDEQLVHGGRAAVNAVYQVKVVVPGRSYQPAKALADRIDALLHAKSGTAPTNGVNIIESVRIETVRYPEVMEGKTFRHLGGMFRIYAG